MNSRKQLMTGKCRICSSCNGHGCIGQLPGMGGSNQNLTFIRNIERLNTAEISEQTPLSYEMFLRLCAIAPMTGVEENMGFFPDEFSDSAFIDYYKSSPLSNGHESEYNFLFHYTGAAVKAGCMPCIGDGAHDFKLDAGLMALKYFKIPGAVFFKPYRQNIIFERLEKLDQVPLSYVGIDIDAINLVNMSSQQTMMERKTPEHIAQICERLSVPFIVKGVLDTDTAQRFLDAGATGVVVSNHGGRVGDLPASVDVLSGIAFQFSKKEIWFDSGVRSGKHIAAALSRGATRILVGRPAVISVFLNGMNGVEIILKKYYDEYNQLQICSEREKIK